MAGEGLFFGSNISLFVFFLLWLAYVLWWHADCKLGADCFWVFFPSLRWGDRMLKHMPSLVPSRCAEGSGSEFQNGKPDPQPWSWETLWSSGWLLTTERGSQHGVGVVWGGSHKGFKYWMDCNVQPIWMTEQNYPEGVQLRHSGLDRATLKIYNFVALYPNRIQAYVCCKIFTC